MTTKKGVSMICELWNTFMIFFSFEKQAKWVKSVLISVNDQLIIMNIKVLIVLTTKQKNVLVKFLIENLFQD